MLISKIVLLIPIHLLVTKDSQSKRFTADVLPSKGSANPYCVDRLVKVVMDAGHHRCILRSDQEPAILDLRAKATAELKLKAVGVIPEDSPVGESQSSWSIENAVRDIKAKTRTIIMAISITGGKPIPIEIVLIFLRIQIIAVCARFSSIRRIDISISIIIVIAHTYIC